jgi:hypothetical protein
MAFRARDRETEFKRHIESWSKRRSAVEFHSRQIVKRIAASANQAVDSVQAAFTASDLDCSVWDQAKAAQPRDEGQVRLLELRIIRDVQEDCLCGCMRYFLSKSSRVDTFSLSLTVPSVASPRTPGAKHFPYTSRRVSTFVSLRFSRIVPSLSRLRPSSPRTSSPRLLRNLGFVVTISSNSVLSLRTPSVLTPISEATSFIEGYGVDMRARVLMHREITPNPPSRQKNRVLARVIFKLPSRRLRAWRWRQCST